MNQAASEVVVFDFDGTLVSGDSFLDFAVRYCLVRPVRLALVIAVLPAALLALARSRTAAASALLWAMTVLVSTRSFVQALHRFAAHNLPGRAHEVTFAELTRQLELGRRVVIATGSLPLLVRVVLRARNIRGLGVVGSRFRRGWGALVVETHCVGRTKVEELRRRLGIEHWSSVYTDSFADRSLMRRAQLVTLVAPSPRTLVQARNLVGTVATLRVLRPGSGLELVSEPPSSDASPP